MSTPAKHTPGPWSVRYYYQDANGRPTEQPTGVLRDCFVAAPDVNGYPYGAEILGEDEYHEQSGGIARKVADCCLIAAAPTMLDVLRSSVEILDVAIESREEMIGEKDDVMRDLRFQVRKVIALASPVLEREG